MGAVVHGKQRGGLTPLAKQQGKGNLGPDDGSYDFNRVRDSRHVSATEQLGPPRGVDTHVSRSLAEKIVNALVTQTPEGSSGPHATPVCSTDR